MEHLLVTAGGNYSLFSLTPNYFNAWDIGCVGRRKFHIHVVLYNIYICV